FPLLTSAPLQQRLQRRARRPVGQRVLFPAVKPHRSGQRDRKSTRLNSSHLVISYAVFCLKKKKKKKKTKNKKNKKKKNKTKKKQKRKFTIFINVLYYNIIDNTIITDKRYRSLV